MFELANPNPKDFLDSCEVIDFGSREVQDLAKRLSSDADVSTAKNCFEFVRDNIRHCSDYKTHPITCSASETLKFTSGYCYAKSHLLCALLRANQIPAGLCYQRLSMEDGTFCLHGLNAVHLSKFGWYRMDARGNRSDVDAQFTPPVEQLAFPVQHAGEMDLPEIHARPLPSVIECLKTHETWDAVYANVPDLESA